MGPRLVPGTVVGGTFTILRLIGRGGMGEVYEAEHVRLKGRVALKLLRSDVVANTEPYLRFRQEAEITSALRHPHIVQVLDFNEHENVPYIVMERLEGSDLAARVKADGPLSLGRVVSIVDQIASALGAAHAKGIIHRDLKPQNIFLVPMPEQGRDFAKVMDFGISKVLSDAKVISGHSTLLGTPPYMSPEQAQGGGDLDGRSDQFALAAIAYEALCGQPAFQGQDLETVLHQVLHKEPGSLARRVPGVSAAVDQVIKRGMAKPRAERHPTIVEFAQALQLAAEPSAHLRTAAPAPPVPVLSTAITTRVEMPEPLLSDTPVTMAAPDGANTQGTPATPATPAMAGVAVAPKGQSGASTPGPVYVLVREGEVRQADARGRARRLATIALATLFGGAVALGVAAFILRNEIREARRRAAPVSAPLPQRARPVKPAQAVAP